MKIHEYQAKQLLRDAGLAAPAGVVARTPDEAAAAFDQLGGKIAVVKAQIHAGGRGKGTIKTNPQQRGVQLVKSRDEAKAVAANLLGKELVTIQTGPEGKTVQQVLVEAGCDIGRELYLGIVVDRAQGLPVLMASTEGGVNIEEVAAKTPHLILKEHFHPAEGLQPSSKGRRIVFGPQPDEVIDGPFTESKELIAGFWIWKVKDMDEAVAWAKRIPNPDGETYTLEIRPVGEFEDIGDAATPEQRAWAASQRERAEALAQGKK